MAIPALALSRILNVPRSTVYTNWNIGLESLAWVSVLSVIFGFLLARSHYGEITALMLSAIYGLAVIGCIQYLGAPGDPISRFGAIAGRLRASIGGAQDSFILILFMSSLFWFLGHNTAWHVFRIDRVWRAVIPPGIVLLINGLYNFAGQNLDPYLIAYLFFALLLLVRSHLDAREYEWYVNQIRYDARLRTWVLRVGAGIGIIALVIAWTLPTGSAEQNQKRFQQFVNGDVFNAINKLASKLFAPLEGQNTNSADYYGRDELQLTGAIQLGNQVVMTVKAPKGPQYYWKSRSFDNYSNGIWRSQNGATYSADQVLNTGLPAFQDGTRSPVQQTFTMVTGPTRLVYTAPQAAQVYLPSEMQATPIDVNRGSLNVSVIHPKSALQEGSTYTAISYISTANAATLRLAARPPNEAWLAPYLQIDPSIAPQTRARLLPTILQGQVTNYDKAKAIERWLRANITYNEAISAPPYGRDLVDWVIFEQKEAYCTYYATAMVMMLRSVGIPARMAAGFSQGVWDNASQSYFVRERDAHTWVEVYFPGAGWVEFEPTAAQQEIGRADANTARATSTPVPTNTPIPTNTPLPTPTPPNQQQNPNEPTKIPPTETPKVSPTPTQTPTPPIPPPDNRPSPFIPILRFMAIASAIIGAVFFLFVGMLWWFEYRGLDKLTPVGRAYARLGIYSRLLRIFHPDSATPLERGRKLTKEVPEQSKAIAAITDMYIYERYAPPHTPTPQEEVRANRAWQAARAALIKQWRQRLFRRKQ
jgi:transglutaminase-like putative cysteine protease